MAEAFPTRPGYESGQITTDMVIRRGLHLNFEAVKFAQPDHPLLAKHGEEEFNFNYTVMSAFSKMSKHKSGMVIGCGDGVSAAALLYGGVQELVMVDEDFSLLMCHRLKIIFPEALIYPVRVHYDYPFERWLQPALQSCRFDVIQINAWPSYQRCRRYLEMCRTALRSAGHMVVSGYAKHKEIRGAVRDFLWATGDVHLYLHTIEGHMLIQNDH